MPQRCIYLRRTYRWRCCTVHRQRRIGAQMRLGMLLLTTLALGRFNLAEAQLDVTRYTVNIVRTLPHSATSFTQGLVYADGLLYESTGLVGQSSLQKLDAATGQMLERLALPDVFAEGLARWEDRLIQLTWQDRTAFIYRRADFARQGMFQYETEGWGLTADEQSLIMSDGTDALYFRQPQTFALQRVIHVTFEGKPVAYLNELEYIDGLIYANIWHQNVIIQIDPTRGAVVGLIDATPLIRQIPPLHEESVLNGIAYRQETNTIFLTGKNWPAIFEVTLKAKGGNL